jgi:hypothetical protein
MVAYRFGPADSRALVLLFCDSATDWGRAGSTGALVTSTVINGLIA